MKTYADLETKKNALFREIQKNGCLLVSYNIVGLNDLVSSGFFSANATEYREVYPHPPSPTNEILISYHHNFIIL